MRAAWPDITEGDLAAELAFQAGSRSSAAADAIAKVRAAEAAKAAAERDAMGVAKLRALWDELGLDPRVHVFAWAAALYDLAAASAAEAETEATPRPPN
jgi:hypothetical protein